MAAAVKECILADFIMGFIFPTKGNTHIEWRHSNIAITIPRSHKAVGTGRRASETIQVHLPIQMVNGTKYTASAKEIAKKNRSHTTIGRPPAMIMKATAMFGTRARASGMQYRKIDALT